MTSVQHKTKHKTLKEQLLRDSQPFQQHRFSKFCLIADLAFNDLNLNQS
jgi:hypothetical protein